MLFRTARARWSVTVSVLFFVLITGAGLAHAALPYAPGQTLDPACHPGDANCTVQVFTASGDLSGSSTRQTVIGLQGNPIASTTPTSSQVLQWNGSAWAPATLSVGTSTNYWSATSSGIYYNASGSVAVGNTVLSAQQTGQVVASNDFDSHSGGLTAAVNRTAVVSLLNYATTERIAVVGLGDSNQCKDGNNGGWDGGIGTALAAHYGTWGTGVMPMMTLTTPCGPISSAIVAWGQGTWQTSGAPSALGSLWNDISATFPYGYLPDGTTATSQPFVTDFDWSPIVNGAGKAWLTYGTFPSGTESTFLLTSRRGNSPYTTLVTGSTVQQVTGSYGLSLASASITAATRNYPIEWKLNATGVYSSGPFFGLFWQIEDTAVTKGTAYSTLLYWGGKGLYDYNLFLDGLGTAGLTTYFTEVRRLLGANKVVVVTINSGANDRNEGASLSNGPTGGLSSATSAGYADNLQGVMNRIKAIWTANGWDTTKLGFLIIPTHEISSGNAVTSLTLTDGGTCTTSFPLVFTPTSGGSGAAGYAVSNGTLITRLQITSMGSGYIGVPTIGNGGCALAATAVLGGGDDSELVSYRRISTQVAAKNANTAALLSPAVATAVTSAANTWFAAGSAGATDVLTNIHLQFSGYIGIGKLLIDSLLAP